MTDQGTNKTGFARDDEMKKEMHIALKANRAVRADEEFAEPQPSDQDPALAEPARTGAPPTGMTPQGVYVRNDLARHLDRSVYPARRGALLGALHRHQAPDSLVDRVSGLPPDEVYPNVQAVVQALGYGVEDRRNRPTGP
ncbi:Protein of unknown function [Actinacidiphila yanglinensis]|uniref:DUF2795 domain-containing protein n=1 Tax=Actinacidiphila yanglinensis TaxID=310779 RepID=A0A1H6D9J1_9ACTN|nr:DUF2795 domain-containing protein [Actinacidiphila yanglinensis]SEG81774.1 Protein of unknown function [Actinacidiphila yanglinensis]